MKYRLPIWLIASTLMFSGISVAQSRRCDSERTPFFTDRKELSCMACEMEFLDEDFSKEVGRTSHESNLNSLRGPSDRYWAMLAIAARQFYSENGKAISTDEKKKIMIRLASAMGPCRENFFDPNAEPSTQLRPGFESPNTKNYKFPDLGDDGLDISAFAGNTDVYLPTASKQDRTEGQGKIVKALGFEKSAAFVDLLRAPKNFDNLSHEQLRYEMKSRMNNIGKGEGIFSKSKAGGYMLNCAKQIQTNMSGSSQYGPKPEAICERLTRSCFKKDTDTWVYNVCDLHGLNTPKGGSVSGGPISNTSESATGPSPKSGSVSGSPVNGSPSTEGTK
jgi:hypothetical protein